MTEQKKEQQPQGTTLLTAPEILAADDRQVIDVKVPEWGGTVRLMELSGGEAIDFTESLQGDKNSKARNMAIINIVKLCVVDEKGAPLGKVAAIHNFGAGDIVEIRLVEGGPNLLVPFTETTVPEVDIEKGRLTVIVPEGLVE